jgi:hypothetical protein
MIVKENIVWFCVKTFLTFFFCFPLLFFVLEGLLGLRGNWFSLILIYFVIYETLNLLFFFYNIKVIIFIVSFIDTILVILSLVLFIFFTHVLFSNPEGYWAWLYYPTIVVLFYYGLFGIVIDILYGLRKAKALGIVEE